MLVMLILPLLLGVMMFLTDPVTTGGGNPTAVTTKGDAVGTVTVVPPASRGDTTTPGGDSAHDVRDDTGCDADVDTVANGAASGGDTVPFWGRCNFF